MQEVDTRFISQDDLRLRAKNLSIDKWTPELETLASDLFDLAIKSNGVGLAAPQIGINIKLAVIDISMGSDPSQQLILINPMIVRTFGKKWDIEGCLSIPNYSNYIYRPDKVIYRTKTKEGKFKESLVSGFLARAVCHEIDHLNGILFTDYLVEES